MTEGDDTDARAPLLACCGTGGASAARVESDRDRAPKDRSLSKLVRLLRRPVGSAPLDVRRDVEMGGMFCPSMLLRLGAPVGMAVLRGGGGAGAAEIVGAGEDVTGCGRGGIAGVSFERAGLWAEKDGVRLFELLVVDENRRGGGGGIDFVSAGDAGVVMVVGIGVVVVDVSALGVREVAGGAGTGCARRDGGGGGANLVVGSGDCGTAIGPSPPGSELCDRFDALRCLPGMLLWPCRRETGGGGGGALV